MNETIDYGHITLGSSRTFTWVFQQEIASVWTTLNPGVAPVLNITVGGVKTDESSTLTHPATGTYVWAPLFTVPGFHSGTIYAPSGAGEDAQPFVFVVDADPNYP